MCYKSWPQCCIPPSTAALLTLQGGNAAPRYLGGASALGAQWTLVLLFGAAGWVFCIAEREDTDKKLNKYPPNVGGL